MESFIKLRNAEHVKSLAEIERKHAEYERKASADFEQFKTKVGLALDALDHILANGVDNNTTVGSVDERSLSIRVRNMPNDGADALRPLMVSDFIPSAIGPARTALYVSTFEKMIQERGISISDVAIRYSDTPGLYDFSIRITEI